MADSPASKLPKTERSGSVASVASVASTSITPKTARSDSVSSVRSWGPAPSSRVPLFANLNDVKRKPDNPTHVARRMSIHDQHTAPGFIGQMWNTWVRGINPNAK